MIGSKSEGKKNKEEKKGKKEKKEVDPAKPKKAIGAYFFFSNETVPKLKQEQGISHKDAMSAAGKLWNSVRFTSINNK